jgi:hypothetical protein
LKEFKECSSEYEVPDKQSSGEISDDGEFREAKDLKLVDDDGTEALMIEVQKKNKMIFPSTSLQKEVTEMRMQGLNSTRAKGNKHFTQVGYANGPDQKAIPRWAADDKLIEKIVRSQN